MVHYDVIVCGAGPAGATAAMTVAQAGLKVALFEKYPLPRHKTCGGGAPMVLQKWLYDLAPNAFVEGEVSQIRHTWKFGDAHLGQINPAGCDRPLTLWMMQRSVFDQALTQTAAAAGATVCDGVVVQSLERSGDRLHITARPLKSRQSFVATADYVIGADGANGITAAAANLRRYRRVALAMEIEYPFEAGTAALELGPETAHLEYGAVPQGYAWIFPKKDHLNIGAGVFCLRQQPVLGDRAIVAQLRRAIIGYLETWQLPFQLDQIQFHAHPLPIWAGAEPLHTPEGRILLVGDAAGLVNPFFGDGILHAVKSGVIAAQCLIQGNPTAYSERIHQEVATNFDAALSLAKFFYQYPQLAFKVGVKHPKGTRIAAQLLAGEIGFEAIRAKTLKKLRSALVGSWLQGS